MHSNGTKVCNLSRSRMQIEIVKGFRAALKLFHPHFPSDKIAALIDSKSKEVSIFFTVKRGVFSFRR